jgi:hypothetical protein
MSPQSIIDFARTVINDTDSVLYRQSNDELLGYVNDGLKEASVLSPEHFKSTGDFFCVAGETEQAISFTDAQRLLDVVRIKGGAVVHAMDFVSMSQFNPGWSTDTAGPAQNWARIGNDPLRFYIYPKAPASQILEVTYIRNPATYLIGDSITEAPESWQPALADYVIYRAESKDDEHVNSGRAVSHYQAFVQKIKGG